MTPDIREKAERLARKFLLGHNQEYLLGTDWHNDLTSAISQALLEAHKAGREEMREQAAKLILDNMLVGDDRKGNERLHPRTNPGNKVGFAYATAIRSIK